MANARQERMEKRFQSNKALLKRTGRTSEVIYPRNIQASLIQQGYKLKDDGIEIGDLYYPIKFYLKQERIGKLKKQNILSVFIFGYMPQDVDMEFFKIFMKGLDRMIAEHTEYSSAKVKAGMTLCIEQESMTEFVEDYIARESGYGAFLANVPMCYESSTGKFYVIFEEDSMLPAHYKMHVDTLLRVFWGKPV